MKVVCRKCGKRFDFEEYLGICPKCGKYFSRSNSQEDSLVKPETGNLPHTIYSMKNTDNKKTVLQRDGKRRPKSFVKKGKIISFFLVVFMIIYPRIEIIADKKANVLKEQLTIKELDEVMVTPEQPLEIDGSILTMAKPKLFEFEELAAPAGWQYIVCEYVCTLDSDSYSLAPVLQVYLKCQDSYFPPLSGYELTKDKNISRKIKNAGIESFIQDYQGKLVFLVPEDAAKGYLEIYEKQERTAAVSGKKIESVYRIPYEIKEGQ